MSEKQKRKSHWAVTQPKPPNFRNLVKEMPGAGYGLLCKCSGTGFLPTAGALFQGLYFKGQGNAAYTPQQVVAASPIAFRSRDELYPSGAPTTTPVNWNFDGLLRANCGLTSAPQMNTFRAVEFSWLPVPVSMQFPTGWQANYVPVDSFQFLGECCANCPVSLDGDEHVAMSESEQDVMSEKVLASGMTMASSASGAHPTDSDGDWLLYGGLQADNGVFGNKLMRNGQPLRARLIAVAACDVHWTYTPFGGYERHIRRPVGDLSVWHLDAYNPWFFPNAPQNCVALWQNAAGHQEFVVSSECRQQPNLVHLNPGEDIYAQVNYDGTPFTPRSGSYSLWIKVID